MVRGVAVVLAAYRRRRPPPFLAWRRLGEGERGGDVEREGRKEEWERDEQERERE